LEAQNFRTLHYLWLVIKNKKVGVASGSMTSIRILINIHLLVQTLFWGGETYGRDNDNIRIPKALKSLAERTEVKRNFWAE